LDAQPDLLFVGFGCPKQEKWINMHYRSLGVPVSVGVGGTIDFLAGKLARAPEWMQKSGTEWVFRLAQEPRRLFGRYTKDLWFFSGSILAQMWRLRSRGRRPTAAGLNGDRGLNVSCSVIVAGERLDFEEVQQHREAYESAITSERPCVLDLNGTQFIDSTGVGLLIRMQKRARSAGQQLILAGLTRNVRRALEMMRLQDFFITVPDRAAAEDCLKEIGSYATVHLRNNAASALPALVWAGELTAANAEEVWVHTMDHLSARALVQKAITIDLGKLGFIDSTGLSVMIRTKKYAARQGLKVRFTGATPNVLNVIRLSRLEDYLLQSE
jgi:N-acetylglucosaminyldiphosphoundecaprenol N-acetyl-beta-D-mannosaminyltransferase